MLSYCLKCRTNTESKNPKVGYTYSACGPFTKNEERFQKF